MRGHLLSLLEKSQISPASKGRDTSAARRGQRPQRTHEFCEPSKDHDLVTDASPDQVLKLFPRALEIGKAFGVITVPVNSALIEIATFREDLGYDDFRRPKGVKLAGDPATDAARRDFTVNALYFDSKTGKVLDLVDGIEDLKKRELRAIGDPSVRFREDALRLLRLVRFASRLGFAIEPKTLEAARDKANLIAKVSAERVRDELALMWSGAHPEKALRLLRELKLLDRVLPEVAKLTGRPDGARTEKRLELLGRDGRLRSSALGWAAVLADTGSIEQIEASCRRLKLSGEETERVCFIVAGHGKIREAFEMREATLLRFLVEPGIEEALAFHRVDALATDGNLAHHEFCSVRLRAIRAQGDLARNWIDGKDLIEIGFEPGPEFSEILRTVEDLALEGKLKSKEEALDYVVRHWVR